jgi:LytS/YehU family sensor histidine kinase/Flp pilus assembly protein TadD
VSRFINILLVFFCTSIFVHAQNIDSLLKFTQNINSSYTDKQSAYKELFNFYKYGNVDSAIIISTKSYELANSQNDLIEMSNALISKGIAYKNHNNLKEALENHQKSLEIAQQSNDDNQITKVLLNLGVIYSENNNYEEAKLTLKKCVEIATENANFEDQVKGLNSLGNVYLKINNYSKAQLSFINALNINEKLQNDLFETVITNNIGNVYLYLNQYEKAIAYYYQSLRIAEKSNNQYYINSALGNIGIIYKKLKKYDKAIANINIALKSYQEKEDKYNESLAKNSLGLIYQEKLDFDSALICFKDALLIKIAISDSAGLPMLFSNIGNIHLQTQHYDSAKVYFSKALLLASKFNDHYNKSHAYLGLGDLAMLKNSNHADNYYLKVIDENINETTIKANEQLFLFYKQNGQYKKALTFYENYTSLKDSLSSENSKLKIEEIETKYEVDKKDTEILLLQKEKELKDIKIKEEQNRSKSQLISILLISGIILLGFTLFIIQLKQKQKNKVAELEKRSLKVETEMLRSQINPHFIFNSLNSIQTFISSNDTLDAERYLAKFASLMRLILENSRQPFITLENEIKTLNLYLELEKLRFGNRFSYEININNIDDEFTMVPPMLAQPYIENSILHGFIGKTDGLINIEYIQKNNKICCIIDDNGIGRKKANEIKSSSSHKKSLGIRVTQERIALLAEEFNTELLVDIIDKTDAEGSALGTKVFVDMPFKE